MSQPPPPPPPPLVSHIVSFVIQKSFEQFDEHNYRYEYSTNNTTNTTTAKEETTIMVLESNGSGVNE
jgi:hypothetical protein